MEARKFSEIKNNKKKKKLKKSAILLIITSICFFVLDVFLVKEYIHKGEDSFGYKAMEGIGNALSSGRELISSVWSPQLPSNNNLTSVLIVGIDTRHLEFDGEEFKSEKEYRGGSRNTDTIMQVVYDHSNGNVFMISIPRDMGVDVNKDCLELHNSIHMVYDKAQANNCPGGGIGVLEETVENITGIEIQYYAFISLETFIDVINAVGETNDDGQKGIYIDVDKEIWTAYPIEGAGWENLHFQTGYQFMDAERALKYARSRKYSTDFDRARRQQQVIKAVKDRVLSSSTLTNPSKIYNLIQAFEKNAIFSEFGVNDIRAAIDIAQDIGNEGIYNIILDPSFGGNETYLNKIPHDRTGGIYYMTPTHWQECPGNEFCRVQEYLGQIIKYPEIYNDKAKVAVYARSYDSTGQPNLSNSLYKNFKNKDYPFEFIESNYLANINESGKIVIYDFSNGEKQTTLDQLSNDFQISISDGNEVSYIRINQEDIAIVIEGD